MKKLLLSTAALLAVGISGAQADTSVSLTIDGEMPRACTIEQYGDFRLQNLDLTSTAQTGAASLTVNCNYGGSSAVTFDSANGGALVSGSNSIPYTAFLSGSPLSGGFSLATPVTWNGFPAVTGTNQTRGFSVQLTPPAVVPAGTYEDTVTVTVAAN